MAFCQKKKKRDDQKPLSAHLIIIVITMWIFFKGEKKFTIGNLYRNKFKT